MGLQDSIDKYLANAASSSSPESAALLDYIALSRNPGRTIRNITLGQDGEYSVAQFGEQLAYIPVSQPTTPIKFLEDEGSIFKVIQFASIMFLAWGWGMAGGAMEAAKIFGTVKFVGRLDFLNASMSWVLGTFAPRFVAGLPTAALTRHASKHGDSVLGPVLSAIPAWMGHQYKFWQTVGDAAVKTIEQIVPDPVGDGPFRFGPNPGDGIINVPHIP